MPDIPGPSSRVAPRPLEGVELPTTTVKGVVTKAFHRTTLAARATITDNFSSLDEFTVVAGEPEITLGRLAGAGVVRHNMELLTDSCKVTGTVGLMHPGSGRLAVCGDKNLTNFYAIEAEQIAGPIYKLHLVKGDTASGVVSGVLGWFLDQVRAVLSLFNPDARKAQTHVLALLTAGDEVAVWYDQPNSVVRGYANGVERLTLDVPRSEIPHGPGYRYHGAASGVSDLGPLFTSYTAEDVPPADSAALEVSVGLTADVQWASGAAVAAPLTTVFDVAASRGSNAASDTRTVTATVTATAQVN